MRAHASPVPRGIAAPSLPLLAVLLIACVRLTACGGDGGISPPVPQTLEVVSGQGQSAEAGAELPQALRVRVLDTEGNEVAGVTISWTAGAGTVSSGSSITGSDGTASVTWTLGTTAGAQTATASAASLAPATFNATATPGPVAAVTVTPDEASLLAPDGTASLSAEARDQHGNVVTDATFVWDSDDDGVATVDGNGTVSAVGAGTATVTATAQGESDSAEIIVIQVGEVQVEPDVLNLEEGEDGTLTATVRDTEGNELIFEVTWSSSDEAVATVDASGVVTAGVPGQATITAEAGGVESTALMVVAAPAFNPTEDTEISGTVAAGSMEIPAGVTVTVTGDLVLQISGDAIIDGTLTGDCVGLDFQGGGDLTLTGTVGNVCDQVEPPEEGPPSLSLVADGTLTVDGDIIPGGDLVLKNSPELQESDFDFDDDGGAAAVLRAGPGAPVAAPGAGRAPPSHALPCFIRNRAIGADAGQPGAHARNGFSRPTGGQVGDGYRGGNTFIACAGDLELMNAEIRGQGGGTGGQAGDPGDPGATKGTDQSRAGNGGNGGNVNIGSNGKLDFNGVTLVGRDGGDGGHAFHKADQPGESSRAVGGKGGTAGTFRAHGKQGINVAAAGLKIDFGNGGDGGDAEARAANGRDGADQCPAQAGGDGFATGGGGGDSGQGLRHKGNVVGLGNITTEGGEGGDGGDADAVAGNGGHGGRDCVDGADGGATTAQGGHGGEGRSTFDGGPVASSVGGMGGDADFRDGGHGGDAFNGCSIGFLWQGLPGGDGGDGGAILGGTGAGGKGAAGDGANGEWMIHGFPAEGGNGGVGGPPGAEGDGAHVSIADPRSTNAGPARAPLEKDQPDGQPGKEDACKGPASVKVTVKEDGSEHEMHVGMTTVTEVEVTLLPGGNARVHGPPPWINVDGGFGEDAIIVAEGTGMAAGFPDIHSSFSGPTFTGLEAPPRGAAGAFRVRVEAGPRNTHEAPTFFLGHSTLSVGDEGGLPGGEAVTYTINAPEGDDPEEKPVTFPDFDPASQLYSAESHWNTPIPGSPAIDPASAAYVQGLVDAGDPVVQLGQFSATVFFADADTPLRTVVLPCGPWWELGVGSMTGVPVPPFAEPAFDEDGEVPPGEGECGEESDQDNHMVILDLADGCEYDFWQARLPDGTLEASWGAAIPLDSDGVYPTGLSTRGSGLPFLGGVIFPGELAAGEINHALAFSYPYPAAGGPVAPATDSDGVSEEAFALPEGARIQLDPALDLNAFGLSAAQRTIAETLQTYGAFLVDAGGESGIGFYGVDPASAQTNPYAGTLGGDDFPSAFPAALLEHMRVLALPDQDGDFADGLDIADNRCVTYAG